MKNNPFHFDRIFEGIVENFGMKKDEEDNNSGEILIREIEEIMSEIYICNGKNGIHLIDRELFLEIL